MVSSPSSCRFNFEPCRSLLGFRVLAQGVQTESQVVPANGNQGMFSPLAGCARSRALPGNTCSASTSFLWGPRVESQVVPADRSVGVVFSDYFAENLEGLPEALFGLMTCLDLAD